MIAMIICGKNFIGIEAIHQSKTGIYIVKLQQHIATCTEKSKPYTFHKITSSAKIKATCTIKL